MPSKLILTICLSLALGFVFSADTGFAAGPGAKGRFQGAGGHYATGSVSITASGGVTRLIFNRDFKLGRYPDPKIGFGNNGYKTGTIIAPLKRNLGGQTYVIPARIDLKKYNQVWLWCERFNVPLAVARLR
jgi:hypothetical protein